MTLAWGARGPGFKKGGVLGHFMPYFTGRLVKTIRPNATATPQPRHCHRWPDGGAVGHNSALRPSQQQAFNAATAIAHMQRLQQSHGEPPAPAVGGGDARPVASGGLHHAGECSAPCRSELALPTQPLDASPGAHAYHSEISAPRRYV